MVLAIDPANEKSAFCVLDGYKPIDFAKLENDIVVERVKGWLPKVEAVAIEMVASYGMAVGRTVFETCVWIGRFMQIATESGVPVQLVYRQDVKMNLCGQMKAKDNNIRQALIDRFARTANGKGTKKEPDYFYGFAADVWAAYAVGVTFEDERKGCNGNQ